MSEPMTVSTAVTVGSAIVTIAGSFAAVRVATRANTRDIADIRGEMREIAGLRADLNRLNQALTGLNGTNGALSEIKLLRERTHQHATKLTAHAFQIHQIAGHVNIELTRPEDG